MKAVLSLPPSTNRLYRAYGNRVYMTHHAKAWKEEAQWRLKALHHGELIEDSVEVIVDSPENTPN